METKKRKYVIVRAAQAGCFAGEIESRPSETMIVLLNARRLWYWSGAASLSQMAQEGVSDPLNCKFPPAVTRQEVIGVIEVIDATDVARKSIEGVAPWRA